MFSSLCVLSSDPETSRLEKRFVKEGRESKTKHKLEDLNYSRIQQYFGEEKANARETHHDPNEIVRLEKVVE